MDRCSRKPAAVALLGAGLLAACSPRSAPAPAAGSATASAPFDVGAVVRRVHFAFRPEGKALTGGHATYASRVEAGRLTVQAAAGAGLGAPLSLETVQLGRSGPGAPLAAPTRLAPDGTVEIDRAAAVERIANRGEGVVQDWRFERRPEGTGDLLVRLRAQGLPFARQTGSGLHFAAAGEPLGLRYGDAAWVDADGRRTALRPEWNDGHVVLRVAAALVDGSRYPAVLDPTVSPEFGIDEPVLSGNGSQQYAPDVASDGSAYLVVWQDNRGTSTQIMGARVGLDGAVLDPYGLTFGVGSRPRVAYGASTYLVVWYDFSAQQVLGSRVAPADGRALDSPAVAISPATGVTFGEPKLASDGTSFLVVWDDLRTNANGEIHASLVSGAATVLLADIAVATDAAGSVEPAVASNGLHYLVVWRDARDGPGDPANIYGARVGPDGALADAKGFAISTDATEQATPAVAAHGTEFYVVWRDMRAGYRLIYGARVTDDKQVLDASGVRVYTGSS